MTSLKDLLIQAIECNIRMKKKASVPRFLKRKKVSVLKPELEMLKNLWGLGIE